MDTKEILKELRKQRKLTGKQVAENCDMSYNVYQMYESGQRNVGVPALCKLADFYDVSTDYLLGRTPIKDPAFKKLPTLEELILKEKDLSDLERRFILVYVRLEPKYRNAFIKALEDAAHRDRAAKPEDVALCEIPVTINLASAGFGFDIDGDGFTYKTFYKPDNVDIDKQDFAVRVEGDSMEPDYPDECYVLIRKYADGEYPRYNDVALFMCSEDDENGDWDGFLKVWKGDNTLHSINPAYEDVQFPFVRPIGEAVCVIERVRK